MSFSEGTPEWFKKEYEFNPPLDLFELKEIKDFRNNIFYTIQTPIEEDIFEPVDVTPGFYNLEDLKNWWLEFGDEIKKNYYLIPDVENFQNYIFNMLADWETSNQLTDKILTPSVVGKKNLKKLIAQLKEYREMLMGSLPPIERGKISAAIEGIKKEIKDLRRVGE